MAAEGKTISSVSLEGRVFRVPEALRRTAYIKGVDEYNKIYKRSIEDPEGFWAECAEQLHWFKKWDKVVVEDFANAIPWQRAARAGDRPQAIGVQDPVLMAFLLRRVGECLVGVFL